jgi:hypothetical protein
MRLHNWPCGIGNLPRASIRISGATAMQFSLKWFLIAITFIAVSIVAMLNANDHWRMLLQNAVLLTVLIGIAGAVCSVGKERAFAFGYVLFALVLVTNCFGFSWIPELATTRVLAALHKQIFVPTEEKVPAPVDPDTFNGDLLYTSQSAKGTIITFIRPRIDHFISVGHTVLSIPFGLLGGLIASTFYRKRLKQAARSSAP